jgi:hypothetical protein
MAIEQPWDDEFIVTVQFLNAAVLLVDVLTNFLYVCVDD